MVLCFGMICVGQVGGKEEETQVFLEPSVKYHPYHVRILTVARETGCRKVLCGQFGWGGLLQKSNGGVQRYTQYGWQSYEEHKGKSVLDCETNRSSRCESRAQ
eukprot:TRINITY_DN3738_c0_g2_i1.p2 TRINITY_DN3738_c0_g2~~TRINITY_DN3738_c0_g2_i1.p2  ORF type:complete len:103 (+),score=2.86 TRINITY_DN3738_c0_g2_i1:283-591(+)